MHVQLIVHVIAMLLVIANERRNAMHIVTIQTFLRIIMFFQCACRLLILACILTCLIVSSLNVATQ